MRKDSEKYYGYRPESCAKIGERKIKTNIRFFNVSFLAFASSFFDFVIQDTVSIHLTLYYNAWMLHVDFHVEAFS